MKARVLFTDTQAIRSQTGQFGKALKELNELNAFLTEHRIGPLTGEMVGPFLRNPREALRAIYAAKIPETDAFTGLKNNKDKMLEGQQLPVAPTADSFPYIGQVKDELYVFDFGETVTLNAERFESYLNGFRYVSSDPEVIQAYDDFQALAKQLDKLNSKLHFIPLNGVTGINTDYLLGEQLPLTARGFELQKGGFMYAIGMRRR